MNEKSSGPFTVEISERALKSLEGFPKKVALQILTKISRLEKGLVGDIKRLHAKEPIYRLRSGSYRVLFEIEGQIIFITDVGHRKNVYR